MSLHRWRLDRIVSCWFGVNKSLSLARAIERLFWLTRRIFPQFFNSRKFETNLELPLPIDRLLLHKSR